MSVNLGVPVDQPMVRRFGDRTTFAVEVGGLPAYVIEAIAAGHTGGSRVREVDLWAGGRCLTRHDNAAYVPILVHYMRYVVERVQRRDVPRQPFPWRSPAEVFRLLSANDTNFKTQFWLLRNWDEILDHVETYTWLDDQLVFACRLPEPLRTQVFVGRVDPDEFVSTLDEAISFLDSELAQS